MNRRRFGAASIAAFATLSLGVSACTISGQPTADISPTTTTVTASARVPSSAELPPTAPSAATFTAELARVRGQRGSTAFDIDLPQLAGGNDAVRERFNSGMRTAFDDVLNDAMTNTSVTDGQLLPNERSKVVTITPNVVAGTAIFSSYTQGGAHPSNLVATITTNAKTAQPILLSDVFVDPTSAAQRISSLLAEIDSRATDVPPTTDSIANWVPTAVGFRAYVPVIHALGDYLPVTVPWNDIDDLLEPGMRTMLSAP